MQVVKAVNRYGADVLLAQVGLAPSATVNFALTDVTKEESRRYKIIVKKWCKNVKNCFSFAGTPWLLGF